MGKIDAREKELEIVSDIVKGVNERQQKFYEGLSSTNVSLMIEAFSEECLEHLMLVPNFISDPEDKITAMEMTQSVAFSTRLELAKMKAVYEFHKGYLDDPET